MQSNFYIAPRQGRPFYPESFHSSAALFSRLALVVISVFTHFVQPARLALQHFSALS